MPRVLVVEDEDDIREGIAELLRLEGYEVATAADGAAALSLLRSGSPAPGLILLDLMMPDIDGLEFRRQQLADPALAAIPVVILSAAHGAQATAATVGVAGFIAKPVDVRLLLSLVQRYCAP